MRLNVMTVAVVSALMGVACSGEYESFEELEGVGENQESIEGGETVTSGQGSVRVKIGTNGWCSGAIIGPRTIVTAAHCATSAGYGSKDTTAQVEYYDQRSWWCLSESAITNARCTTSRAAKSWVNPVHETATGKAKREADFAILSMNRDFSYTLSGHRMLILEAPTKASIGDFNAIGYGANKDGDTDYSDPPFLARFALNTMESKYFDSRAGVISGSNADTGMRLCSGDSGSPQWDLRGANTRLLFGLHSGRNPSNGECAEYKTLQEGPVVGQYVSKIETHLGRACRHINFADYGRVMDCWP
jgi:hypothetical protein